MKKNELFKWVIANALGFGVGFVMALQLGMLIQHGLDFEKHWVFQLEWDYSIWGYIASLIGFLALGAVVGWAQAMIIKVPSIKPVSWVIVTIIGFGLNVIILDWPLHQLGNLPGPLDPIIVTIGGGIFAGVVQYFFLKKRGIIAKKWLLIWIVGLILSLIPTGLFFMYIGSSLDLSWPMEVLISGALAGGVAAWISGKTFFRTLRKNRQS